MEREKLQQQYARILLQLETEARTIGCCQSQSKLARSARATIEAAGITLNNIAHEWGLLHPSGDVPILPELQTYSGFEGRICGT